LWNEPHDDPADDGLELERDIRILLVEAADRILPGLPKRILRAPRAQLARSSSLVSLLHSLVPVEYLRAADSSAFRPWTLSVTDEGGSPSGRSQLFFAASRLAASTASVFVVASLAWTFSTLAQLGGCLLPVTYQIA
jgi:hypothetical protein